ncbi:MAG: hypothetical protein IT364_13180 [Candidatus Hydrogenedentes bacterium]|nr:hypothetical protein [Candidatus Hydrogenedentota bacterium]
MARQRIHPSWRISTLILVSVSLSIGWGIRGNFGHEYGAMLPGVLASIAVCLMSGREDWRRRVAYFAFFGALGWAFGGSFSYMKVVSYTHSGHLPSQLYGFFGLFAGSFLWSALGGAGTAYAAVESRDRLTQIFRPLCWVLVVWVAYYFFWEAVMNRPEVTQYTGGAVVGPERGQEREMRQNDPFYWLDADVVPAFLALVALCAFDLWERRSWNAILLPLFAAAGGAVGWGVQWLLMISGALPRILPWFVRVQGDLSIMNPDTGQPFDPANMVTNWPTIFSRYSPYVGVLFGGILAIAIYYAIFGKWRSGASLLVHMAVGWFIAFLVLPVLLGIRMTPPRGDNWAGGLGMLLGILVYMFRNKLVPVAVASILCGTIGGLGIAFTQCLKLLLIAPGNPERLADLPPEVRDPIIAQWAHWQSANWHSIVIEQGVGLIYGLGLAVAMAILAKRMGHTNEQPPERRWTEAFAAGFVLIAVVYVNMVKCVNEWTTVRQVGEGTFRSVPEVMKMPLFESIQFSAYTWFCIVYYSLALCIVVLLSIHMRRRLPFMPITGLGKGQLLYLVFVWIAVTFNFMKALVAFHESRIATEGVLFMNAVIATFLLVAFAREEDRDVIPVTPIENYRPLFIKSLVAMCVAAVFSTLAFTGVVRSVYGNHHPGGYEPRFGSDAGWRLHPILRDVKHR